MKMVSANQRFKSDRPCPICGGHADLPQGEGLRCYGFLAEDRLYAHCTREEHAGGLALNFNSNAFPHRLEGSCGCRKAHGAGTLPVRDQSGGSSSIPGIDTYRHPRMGKPSQVWPYRYPSGELACYVARWDLPDGSKVIRPLSLEDQRWRQKGILGPRPFYNLQELLARPDAPVLVVEGEKTSDAAQKRFPSHVSTTSMHGSKSPQKTDFGPLRGREVVVWPDYDPEGQRYAKRVTELALQAGASSVSVVQLPEGLPEKWDLADRVPEGIDLDRLLSNAQPYAPSGHISDTDAIEEETRERRSQGDLLIYWATERADLCSDGGETYASIWIEGCWETLAVRSLEFSRWLRRLYWELVGKGVLQTSLNHAVENLDALASRAGQRGIYLRVASYEGKLYIDAADDARSVVEVDSQGWSVLNEPPPIRFRRTPNSRALPLPASANAREGIKALREFLNVGEEDFVLCVGWLLAALRDTGPYPLLMLTGEQGSAKSTAARLLRSLIDPASPPTRGRPRDERDVMIEAHGRHVLAYDNVSGLPVWLSDSLCRIATGAGYGTRALFTDREERVFEVWRPVIVTGIENPAVRGDLADRSLIIRLNPIAEKERRTESEVMAAFEDVRPQVLGALLGGLAEGLRRYDSIRLERMPRMADFCKWVTACEAAYWPSGTFMAAYRYANKTAMEDVLEDSPVGLTLRSFLDETRSFQGNAGELLEKLDEHSHVEKRPKGWPTTDAGMGKQLMRLAPTFRNLGYTVGRSRTSRNNVWNLDLPAGTSGHL